MQKMRLTLIENSACSSVQGRFTNPRVSRCRCPPPWPSRPAGRRGCLDGEHRHESRRAPAELTKLRRDFQFIRQTRRRRGEMRTSGENTAMRGRDFLNRGLAVGALSMALAWPCGAASIPTGSDIEIRWDNTIK